MREATIRSLGIKMTGSYELPLKPKQGDIWFNQQNNFCYMYHVRNSTWIAIKDVDGQIVAVDSIKHVAVQADRTLNDNYEFAMQMFGD